MSSAGCGLIQTSTERAHGPAVLLGERFESGIIRNLRFNFHGSRERIALHLRRPRDRDYYCGYRGNRDNDR